MLITFAICLGYYFVFKDIKPVIQEVIAGIAVFPIEIIVVTILLDRIMEGGLSESLRRRRMGKLANKYTDHYIICGIGAIGLHVINELHSIGLPHVLIDINKSNLEKALELFKDEIFIEGDADENEVLLQAGIKRAKGLFALTGDDNQNLVISLTAKQLNHDVRIVARCNEIQSIEKMKRAGADAIISPNIIGAMRMASEMIRPTAVSFLDIMLRDREKNLRVEEFVVPDSCIGKKILDLDLKRYISTVLLAIKTKDKWIYGPPENHVIKAGDILIVMTTPEARDEIEKHLKVYN